MITSSYVGGGPLLLPQCKGTVPGIWEYEGGEASWLFEMGSFKRWLQSALEFSIFTHVSSGSLVYG